MATITLYKDKLNGVGGLIDNIIKSSNNLDTQLETLKSTLQGVSSSTYNLQDTVNSISSSSKTEKEKVGDLKKLNKKVTEFITTTVNRDNSARDEINKSKKDFYSRYSYLKPECEKDTIEKIVDDVEKAADWCAEHWKIIVTAVIVVVAVVLLCTGVGTGLGAAILAGACWGAIFGAVIGGVSGGINSLKNGGSLLAGFENGSFDGAVGGMIGGAIAGGFSLALKPGMSLNMSILKNAGVGAVSSSVSNMSVTTLDCWLKNGNLKDAFDDISIAGISGAISGFLVGGLTGSISYFVHKFKTGLTNSDINKITNTQKGNRQNPSTYLSKDYIDNHLAQFDDGVSVIQTEWAYSRYSKANGFVGVPDDNSLFVMPKKYCDDVISNANGNISIIEKELGFQKGYFSDGGGLVRIDVDDVSGMNLRIPSGNETGANSLWLPGGFTSGDVPEAISDIIPLNRTNIIRIDVN